MAEGTGFERDLARLIAACETGLDLPGVLGAAAEAVRRALGAAATAVYTLSEGGGELTRMQGDGPATLDVPARARSCRWSARGGCSDACSPTG